ncbi:MAG: nucleotide exchange factor GrpE [Rhizobiaceae bacterium]|nr:nucleotide exchange factor GrpE [Rhizobiaceae bacterium]
MSGQPKEERTPDENAVKEEYAETAGFAGEAAPEGAEGDTQADDHEVLLRLVKENEELKDARLRAAAEMENLRRRTARDVHDARNYAIANFARDMLSVSDNLKRALEAIPQEARDSGDAGFKALIEGVEMTERAMLAALERHGVKKLDPEGERFDPNFHQAMFEVPREDIATNTVVQVVQTGYVIGERVLRPAMVGVSKGGPKAAPAEAEAPATEPGPPNEQAEKDA